ncbi:MAG: M56 family metallopeptidase [Ferruginibacter sp.]
MTFFYSFTQTILHSLWQAVLLVLLHSVVFVISKKNHPLQKRNFLYFLLFAQLCVSLFTFWVCFNGYQIATALAFRDFINLKPLSFINNYNTFIFLIYLVVVLAKTITLIVQWFYFKKSYKRELERPSAALKVFSELKAYQLGIKRKVEIWYSNNIETPITFGFLKPIIILPMALVNNISVKQTESIILHELAHIKSKDYLLNWLLLGIEIIYFFNPFVKLLTQKLKQEREKNCDVQVINFEYEPMQYAQTLLGIATHNMQVKSFQLGFLKKRRQLLHRIRFFSNEKNLTFAGTNAFTYLIFIMPLVCIMCFSVIGKRLEMSYQIAASAPIQNNDFLQNWPTITAGISFEPSVSKSAKSAYKMELYKEPVKNEVVKIIKEQVNETASADNLYVPVSLNETPDSTKEIIYKLETQNGKITQSYKLVQKNGRWTFEPQWMIVETRPTMHPVFDSAQVFNLADSIQ